MGRFKRGTIYVVGVAALITVIAVGTEYGNRIVDTGKLKLKDQRDVYKQRDLYKKIKESEEEVYNDLWYQLTAEPGYADNNPKDGIISLGEKRKLWEAAGRYDSKKGNPVAGMATFPDGSQVFPPLTTEDLERAISSYNMATP